jgi:ribosomal protein S18 acetylase RimI-like enzyme
MTGTTTAAAGPSAATGLARLRQDGGVRPHVTLRPMSEQEYEAWSASSVEAYAGEIAASTGRDVADLRERAAIEFAHFLPNGQATAGHWLLTVLDDGGVAVGSLWLGPDPRDPNGVFVFDIEIAPQARNRGIGRAAMLAIEEFATRRGRASIGLNVFGANIEARRLYDSLGYMVVSTSMLKQLGHPE